MELTFANAAGATLTAQLEPEMTTDEIIQELVANGFISEIGPYDGGWALFVPEKGRLEEHQSLADSCFEDGDLVLVTAILADGRSRFVVISQAPAKNTKIRVTCKYNGRVWFLKFDSTATVEDIHQYLSEKYDVPRDDVRIDIINGKPGQLNVLDGSILEFILTYSRPMNNVPAYGCPMADSAPGLVPDCTTTDSDAIDRVLL